MTKIQKDIFAVSIFFLFWFGLFFYSGTFTSGYHFIDDQDIISLNAKINNTSFLYTAKNYITFDLNWRFRPFWSLHRVAEIKLFGTNFKMFGIYTGLLCLFTSFFLYKFASTIGFKYWQSIVFTFLTLVNPASVIWYQLADSENIGMLFLSLSLFLMAKSIYSEKKKSYYEIGFVISLAVMSLCKESFTIIVPAILFMYVWIYSVKNNTRILKTLMIKKTVLIIPLILFVLSIFMILFFVGTNKTGYAGVDKSLFDINLPLIFIKTFLSYNIFIIMLIGVFILIYSNFSKNKNVSEKNIKDLFGNENLNIIILFSFIVLPQYLLYYKTGLHFRYFLPFMLGFSLVEIILIKKIFDSQFIKSSIKYLYISLVAGLLVFEVVSNTVPLMTDYDNSRRAMTGLLNSIEDNSEKDSVILTIMDPVQHWGYGKSVYIFLTNNGNNNKLYFKFEKLDTIVYPYDDPVFYDQTEQYTRKYFNELLYDSIKTKEQIQTVNIFPGLEDKFLNESKSWFNKDEFRREEFNNYIVYYRKKLLN